RHTILVTCVDGEGNPNIITLAWSMVTSFNPPMIAISVAPKRYSFGLIKHGGE
ncbi:MAG: flavin reductase family protein, partial [Candidatus Aminicenantes bacterium]|nr:flavin reductase family protein [Candidatus Aminicenantes bacterium]NIN20684.1 flavin reductase family protein [Candidatus Aminicenantes bacterium]NIN44460.1 flavin reductase family protein [Candidatus Aminicenantes bacterium]NIN87282.1 flavin reductase family protein [Candidatus Aminicenantes bacterium]NIO83580.1 flavin reductase family protein [Candidatus Aminicenantes bacterium]